MLLEKVWRGYIWNYIFSNFTFSLFHFSSSFQFSEPVACPPGKAMAMPLQTANVYFPKWKFKSGKQKNYNFIPLKTDSWFYQALNVIDSYLIMNQMYCTLCIMITISTSPWFDPSLMSDQASKGIQGTLHIQNKTPIPSVTMLHCDPKVTGQWQCSHRYQLLAVSDWWNRSSAVYECRNPTHSVSVEWNKGITPHIRCL